MMPVVCISADGSCTPNPGVGKWGAILEYEDRRKKICGKESEKTTNNRMELLAAIRALESLKVPCRVRLESDSQYLVMTMRGEYRRGTNLDLWTVLDAAAQDHEVEWVKVPAHIGRNKEVHDLAESAE